jgi:hypothetical protein
MPNHRNKLTVSGDRTSVRKQVIIKFLDEEPGTGTGENCSKYIYEVETTKKGNKVILKRPANLNKGMDFTVNVEGIRFKEKGLVSVPSHSVIIQDLTKKKEKDSTEYKKVKAVIRKIHNCEILEDKDYENIEFSVGQPIDVILKSIKWLFIEQDVTYWNWSGRSMLFSALHDKGLC